MDCIREQLTKIMNEPGRRESAELVEKKFAEVAREIASRRKLPLIEIEIEVSICLGTYEKFNVDVCRALNKFHTGSETLSLKERVINDELLEATRLAAASRLKKVKVKVYSDGSLEHEFVD